MLKKNLSIIFVIVLFLFTVIYIMPHDNIQEVVEVNSPINLKLEKTDFLFEGLDTFDSKFSEHNKILATKLGISEEEAYLNHLQLNQQYICM